MKTTGAGRRRELDFEGVAGVTPSFLDELLVALAGSMSAHRSGWVIRNLPGDATAKLTLLRGGHSLSITQNEDGTWLITGPPE